MKRRKLNPENEATLAALRDRLLLTIEFIESVQDFPSGPQIREVVSAAADRADLRTLRLMARDVDAMTVTLAPREQEDLNARLKEGLGVDRVAERAQLHRTVAAALERGHIASEKERRRLVEYVEILKATNADPAEIRAVWQLIQSD